MTQIEVFTGRRYEIVAFANGQKPIYYEEFVLHWHGHWLLVAKDEPAFYIYSGEMDCPTDLYEEEEAFDQWVESVEGPITREKAREFVGRESYKPLAVVPISTMRRLCEERTLAEVLPDNFRHHRHDCGMPRRGWAARAIMRAAKLEMGWPLVADDILVEDEHRRSRELISQGRAPLWELQPWPLPLWMDAVGAVGSGLFLGALVAWFSSPWSFTQTTTPSPGVTVLLEARGVTLLTWVGILPITAVFGSLAYLLYFATAPSETKGIRSALVEVRWLPEPLPRTPQIVGSLVFVLLSLAGVGAVVYFQGGDTHYIVDKAAGVLRIDNYSLIGLSETRMVNLDQIDHIEYHFFYAEYQE